MLALILRDVRRGYASGGATLVVGFFLLVAILFPFAIGPDATLLTRIGGGVIWAAALLAALLPVERLVAPDLESGVFDQLTVRGLSPTIVAAAKMAAHWIAFAPPVMAAAVIAAGLLDLDARTLLAVEAGLVMLPLAIPLLIFGAGAIEGGVGGLKLLAAVSLLLVAGAPFVAGAAIRAGME